MLPASLRGLQHHLPSVVSTLNITALVGASDRRGEQLRAAILRLRVRPRACRGPAYALMSMGRGALVYGQRDNAQRGYSAPCSSAQVPSTTRPYGDCIATRAFRSS